MGEGSNKKRKKKKDAANLKTNYDNYVAVWLNNLPNCMTTCQLLFLNEVSRFLDH